MKFHISPNRRYLHIKLPSDSFGDGRAEKQATVSSWSRYRARRYHDWVSARVRALGWGALVPTWAAAYGLGRAIFLARDFGRGGISLLLLADNYNRAATISTTKRTKHP